MSTGTSFGLGLSSEEKRDLEQLILASRGRPGAEKECADLKRELQILREQGAQVARMVLNLDRRMKVLFEIIRMLQQRSELVDGRIDALGGKRGTAGGGK